MQVASTVYGDLLCSDWFILSLARERERERERGGGEGGREKGKEGME